MNNKKRIIISINVRWWNAEAAYAINLARGLIIEGNNVWMIVNLNSPVHKKALGFNIPVITDINLDSFSLIKQGRNFRKILKYIDEYKVQIIHSFKSNGSFLFSFARKLRPALMHIRTRGEARPPKAHFINRLSYEAKSCDGVIAVGDIVKNWIQKLGANINHLETIYYGDSSVKYNPNLTRTDNPFLQNLEPETITIALVGRTQDIKGHHQALEALSMLKSSKIHLFFFIKDLAEYPEELEDLRRIIDTENLTNLVTITDFLPELGDVLSLVDIGIVPSLASEVNCRVAVEFFSLGKPVVAFSTGSLPEVIKHNYSGLICEDKTSKSLMGAIKLLLNDSSLRLKMGKNALLEYQTRFNLSALTTKTLNFYKKCDPFC